MINTISEFIAMGGYWPYVWSAYGITVLLLIINIAIPIRRQKQLLTRKKQHAGQS